VGDVLTLLIRGSPGKRFLEILHRSGIISPFFLDNSQVGKIIRCIIIQPEFFGQFERLFEKSHSFFQLFSDPVDFPGAGEYAAQYLVIF